MQSNCYVGNKASRNSKARGAEIFNDQCFRDSLEAIRKFVVARRRKDGKEARKKWDFILADAVRTAVGCQ